jgi:hypothetical protein
MGVLTCQYWGSAGAIAATFVCPLDVVKTRLQVHRMPVPTNVGAKGGVILGSLGHIFKEEGIKGLYRGLSPTMVALLPNWAVSLSLFLRPSLSLSLSVDLCFQCTSTPYTEDILMLNLPCTRTC